MECTTGVIVLVIGGGGREHALCYGLQRSSTCDGVFCAPGNPGISASGDATCIPDLDTSNSAAVISFCQKWNVGLVVVGPEVPLVAGLVDEKGTHEQRFDFAKKADIVVTCCSLSPETVSTFAYLDNS